MAMAHAFHIALSIGPIVSVVNLQVQQNSLQKSRSVNQACNGTVYMYCASVAISWANRMEQNGLVWLFGHNEYEDVHPLFN